MKHPVPKAISNALAAYPDDVEVLALRTPRCRASACRQARRATRAPVK